MDTVETVKKRGRPAKVDQATPMGEYIAEQAVNANERRQKNKVVESYYELCGAKLSLVKKKSSGAVYRTFIGSITDKKNGTSVREFMKRMEKEGRLKVKT
jgi:hypothetical protein